MYLQIIPRLWLRLMVQLNVKSRCVIGGKDSEYTYLFCDHVENNAQATVSNATAHAPQPGRGSEINGADERTY